MKPLTKPITRAVRCLHAPHNVNPELVITIHPNGILEIKEARRRSGVVTRNLMSVYVRALMESAGVSQ